MRSRGTTTLPGGDADRYLLVEQGNGTSGSTAVERPRVTEERRQAPASVASPRNLDRVVDDRGAGLAEFALVLPVLVVVLFGIFEFGIAFNRAQAIEAAAREGARLASISSTTAGDIAVRVDATLAGIPLDNPPNVTVAPGGCAGREGEQVTVTVTTDHNVTVPLLFDRDVTLRGEAVFRCEA